MLSYGLYLSFGRLGGFRQRGKNALPGLRPKDLRLTLGEPQFPMTIADLASQRALDRLSKEGFGSLSVAERDLAVIWQLEASVNNGGFLRYYEDKAGDYANYVPEALRHIGATETASIVEDANALFGYAGPARDRQVRQSEAKKLDARALARLDLLEERFAGEPDDVDELLERYVDKAFTKDPTQFH